jgi:hypothetical protein
MAELNILLDLEIDINENCETRIDLVLEGIHKKTLGS